MVWACIREEYYVGKRVSDGDGGTGGKRRGIPRRKWLDNTRKDLSERHRPHLRVENDADEEKKSRAPGCWCDHTEVQRNTLKDQYIDLRW